MLACHWLIGLLIFVCFHARGFQGRARGLFQGRARGKARGTLKMLFGLIWPPKDFLAPLAASKHGQCSLEIHIFFNKESSGFMGKSLIFFTKSSVFVEPSLTCI